MTVESGLEKIFWIPPQKDFVYFKKMPQISNSVIKIILIVHGGILITECDAVCTYDELNFKPQISSIFHFEQVNES